jgi:hypothetical protein
MGKKQCKKLVQWQRWASSAQVYKLSSGPTKGYGGQQCITNEKVLPSFKHVIVRKYTNIKLVQKEYFT